MESLLVTRVSFRSAESRSLPRSLLLACRAAGRARTTNVAPDGRAGSRSRARCRSCLVTRCRATALPTALLTTKPTLVSTCSTPADGFTACTTRVRRPALPPPRMTVRNSSPRRRRACCGSTAQPENRALGVLSRRQPDATLPPPRGHDRPARTRVHPLPKAVPARATTVVRLVGTLTLAHGLVLLSMSPMVSLAESLPGHAGIAHSLRADLYQGTHLASGKLCPLATFREKSRFKPRASRIVTPPLLLGSVSRGLRVVRMRLARIVPNPTGRKPSQVAVQPTRTLPSRATLAVATG